MTGINTTDSIEETDTNKKHKRVVLVVIGIILALIISGIIIYFATPLKWAAPYYIDKLEQQINGEKFVEYAHKKYPEHQFTLHEYFDRMQNVERKDTCWATIKDENNNEFMVKEDPDTKELSDNYDYIILDDKLAQRLKDSYNGEYIFKVETPRPCLPANERCENLDEYLNSYTFSKVFVNVYTMVPYTNETVTAMVPKIISVTKAHNRLILNISQLDEEHFSKAKNKGFSASNFSDWQSQLKSNNYVIDNGQITNSYKLGNN